MQTESKENVYIDGKPEVEAIACERKLFKLNNTNNNNHHVVPIGILTVLCTIYLLIAGLQSNYNYYFRPGVDAFKLSQTNDDAEDKGVNLRTNGNDLGIQQPVCKRIDIFTENVCIQKDTSECKSRPIATNIQSIKRPKQLKSAKNGQAIGVGNKQLKTSKSLESNKKKDVTKKSNTAEPIIYLFALVFIYLLLKAASDINQHYKSQNKGDKRLRRCSLQSYAQHHQDRRASKDVAMLSKHRIFTEGRSVSLDRCKYIKRRNDNTSARSEVLISMRKNIVVGDHPRTYPCKLTYPAISNLTGDALTEPRTSRRLSVPISIDYQTIHVSQSAYPELKRRGSVISIGSVPDMNIISPNQISAGGINAQSTDTKRRVRMINRH